MAAVRARPLETPATGTAAPAPGLPAAALFAIMCGPFVSMLDGNVTNVAVVDIARELHATAAQVGWTISAYLLALAASLPASAWLARRCGTRRVYVSTLAAFGAASVVCALAPDVAWLVAARAVQGLAGAPMVPLAVSMLFTGDTRHRMPAAIAFMLFLAPALGPAAGGAIVTAAGWRPIFLVNVPLMAAALLGARRLPGDRPSGAARAPFDAFGLALLAAGTTLVTLGASELTRAGILSAPGWAGVAASTVLLVAYGIRARGVRHPALDLRMLRRPAAVVGIGCCTIASIVLWAMLFLVPVFVQQTMGLAAWAAGLVLLPQGVVMGLASPLGARVVRAGRLRLTVVAGMGLLTGTTALLFVVTASTSPWVLAAILAGRGVALALTVQPLVAGLLGGGADVADASTLFTMSQRIGGSLGIAAVAAFYQARVATGAAFADTIGLLVAVAAAGMALALLLPRRTAAPAPGQT